MLQVVGLNPGGAWPRCKRCCGRKRHERCFCSSHRIFRACSSLIRNLCLFLFIWISAVCSSRSAPPFLLFPGLAPALLLAAIFRGRARRARPLLLLYVLLLGAEPKGLEPLLLLYVLLLGAEPKGLEPLLLLYVLLLLLYSSNGSLWQPYERNMGKLWNLAHL